jgi:hypothetical protein
MTPSEIKSYIHERIESLNDAQLKKLNEMLEREFTEELPKGTTSGKRKLGVMKDKVWLSDDWDSDQVNDEIARTFNDGPVFPKED